MIGAVYFDVKDRLYTLRVLVQRKGKSRQITSMKSERDISDGNERSTITSSELLHRGMGHENAKVVQHVLRSSQYGMDIKDNPTRQSLRNLCLTEAVPGSILWTFD